MHYLKSPQQSCMINYSLFLEEDKHLCVCWNPLPTITNKLCFSTKTEKRSPVTRATSVCDGDANQQLLVCLCSHADKGLFSLLNRKKTGQKGGAALLEPHHIGCCCPWNWKWWISQLVHVFRSKARTPVSGLAQRRFVQWLTQQFSNQKSGCGGKWVIDSFEPRG